MVWYGAVGWGGGVQCRMVVGCGVIKASTRVVGSVSFPFVEGARRR